MNKRILVVNKFYYRRGGDCIYSLNLERLLRDAGCEVAVFSMQFPENIASPFSRFFVSEVSFSGGIGSKLKAARRVMGCGDVKKAFSAILDEFKPEVVHLNNIHSYISPVVAEMAKARGCRVLWTLHDFKLLCPSYSCTRNSKPCQLCFDAKFNVVRHRCMKGSMAASVIAYIEALKWNRKRIEAATDTFICPSAFMVQKMKAGGFNPEKLLTLSNFIDPDKFDSLFRSAIVPRKDYALYVGRLSSEKGVETLMRAFAHSKINLKVAGGGPLDLDLRHKFSDFPNIEFLGMQNAAQVVALLAEARFSIMPSECYENNPLSVIESLCAGTPVVGANIGGIPELISPETGVTFESGNDHALLEAVNVAWNRSWDYDAIKKQSLARFAPKHYLDTLYSLF